MIVDGWKPLIIITKSSILDVAAVLDRSLVINKRVKKVNKKEKGKLCHLTYNFLGFFVYFCQL